jgi:pimeloyl-ACP methyl ester carboxylesterase
MFKVLLAALAVTLCLGVPTRAQSLKAPIPEDVTVLSFKLHYLEAGTGKPVILLHGLGGDSSRWEQNITALAADFHVFALDQIGFGQSDKPMANYHVGMLSEFLVEFMNAVRLPKASLVGNSLGAAVAEYTAVHYPDRVDRLVASDAADYCLAQSPGGATLLTPHVLQIMNGVTRDETRELLHLIFHDGTLVTERMVDDNLVMRLRSAYAIGKIMESTGKRLGCNTEQDMSTIRIPTLIVWGKYDQLMSPSDADRLERDIKGSRKTVVDNAGHFPQIERPDEFNRIVREFLRAGS